MQQRLSESDLAEYVSEGEEILQRVSSAISALEKGARIDEHLDAIYRDFHTLKGSSQLFGLAGIARVAHALEAVFAPLRRNPVRLKSTFIDSVYSALDLIDRMVKSLGSGVDSEEKLDEQISLCIPRLIESGIENFGRNLLLLKDGWMMDHSQLPELYSDGFAKIREDKVRELEKVHVASEENGAGISITEASKKNDSQVSSSDSSVRVRVELLDRLMNLAGELVLVRNQMLQLRANNEDPDFLNRSKNLDLVTSEIQAEVMKTRMQPIGNVISQFQRVVRELAKNLGKRIDLTLQGTETEVDKTLLEAIKDPLNHLIRNACDHGIETLEERRKAGKPDTGHVSIRALHEGGQIIVEVSDDGHGLNKAKLAAKAVQQGVLTAQQAEQLSERESFNLIFLPGLTTAAQVSSVSGRGVGMDVVKTNIEKIGGAVEVSSQLGKGTTLRLRIPLTLAIIPALIIKDRENRYAIPQVKLLELLRLENTAEQGKIEFIESKPVYRLRGSLLPLVCFREALGDNQSEPEGQALECLKSSSDGAINIVVLNADGEKFGLMVDEILDTTDVVIKPISSFLKALSTFSGATILGDGSVSLILDVAGIAERANIAVRSQKGIESFAETKKVNQRCSIEPLELLLFRTKAKSVHAIPLCLVHRLEEFRHEEILTSGDRKVVKYRDGIMPVVPVSEILQYPTLDQGFSLDKGAVPTVVIQRTGKCYGLQVEEIVEVVTIDTQIDDSIRDRRGILGNVIHQNQIIVVIDGLGMIEDYDSMGLGKSPKLEEIGSSRSALQELQRLQKEMKHERPKILYAEDVAFFRKQVSRVLAKAGYDVVTAEDGAVALSLIEDPSQQFVLVLSDIEMPEMNGLDLARAIRKNERISRTPLVALTTRFKDSDVEKGKGAGFDLYLEKLNEERLISGISEILGRSEAKLGNSGYRPVRHEEVAQV